jgi:protein-tyrosine phosphatase
MAGRKISHLRIDVASNSVQFDTSIIIEDFLFLGAKGITSNLDQLETLNVGYVVNCSSESIHSVYPPHMQYCHVCVDDGAAADIAQHFDRTCAFLEDAKREKKAVLVHCTMGMSRSASIVLAYLIKHNNMTLVEALEYVKERRPVASPNPGFMNQLVGFEKKVRGESSLDPRLYDAKSRFEDAGSFRVYKE